ncbi:MAG: carbon-nitrogen hydrolase family protein [Anaerolinea sp.]|nr:carbon-nitrogen hydrolase family protein [Anaerolinea sp.]
MPRSLKVATVQMDAAPAPTPDRLARAATLADQAAAQGAQLIVLPELFNVGYEYDDRNYGLAEPLSGQTMTWMKATAARLNAHLAGSFLLLDGDEVFNSAFIVAPDGRTWRYDKIYPYAWERAYFREGRDITIAETDLGKLGMLICWDCGHADLWRRYAGQVDALVVTSCPPMLQAAELVMPDGTRETATAAGVPIPSNVHFQDLDIHEQAGWLGVPVVASAGGGHFRTHLPQPELSMFSQLPLAKALPHALNDAREVVLEAAYGQYAKIIDAQGSQVAVVKADGDGIAVGDVTVADAPPKPSGEQPKLRMPAYMGWLIDWIGTTPMIPLYRSGLRRRWGNHMAPIDPRTLVWLWVIVGALVLNFLLMPRKGVEVNVETR